MTNHPPFLLTTFCTLFAVQPWTVAAVARSEDCCHPSYGCSDSDCNSGESYRGYTGCGAGQYETGRSQCCYGWRSGQCSACANCPAGRHKGAGCSRGGVEACCSADLWDGSACQWTTASCPADYWCPGDGSLHACTSGNMIVSTGLAGQATEAGACAWPGGRSEGCCGGYCSYFQCPSYYGITGCGAGQYETGRSNCPGSYVYGCGQCSACADCPAGRHKGAGCTRGGVEDCICDAGFYCPGRATADGIPCPAGESSEPGQKFCCPADLWDGSACQWPTASCPADYWCPGDGSLHGPCTADGATPSSGLAGQATEARACVLPDGRSEACCLSSGTCSTSSCLFHGATGCGVGQYETGRSTTSSSCGYLVSACADCPAGRHKGAGCSRATSCASTAEMVAACSDLCQFNDGQVFDGTACVSLASRTTCSMANNTVWNGTTCDALSSAWNEQGCCET